MRKILLIIFIVLSRTSFSQNLEVRAILGQTGDTIEVYFSQKIKTIANSTEFKLNLDSLDIHAPDICFINLNMFVKTTESQVYIQQKFLYPLVLSWDTVLQGRVISYEVLDASVIRVDSLEPLIKNINNLKANLNLFPNCLNNNNLRQLHKSYYWLLSYNQNNHQYNQINNWIAQKLTDIAEILLEKDCPQAALALLQRSKEIATNYTRANILLANFYFKNGQYLQSYKLLKSCYQNISNDNIYEIHNLAKKLIIKLSELSSQNSNQKKAYYFISYADTLRTLFTLNQIELDSQLAELTENYFEQEYDSSANAIEQEDLDKNLGQFKKLILFYIKHKNYLNDSIYKIKLRNLLNQLLENIDLYVNTNNYNKAIKALNELFNFCRLECNQADRDIFNQLLHKLFKAQVAYTKYLIEHDSLQAAKEELRNVVETSKRIGIDTINTKTQIYNLNLEYLRHSQDKINFYLINHSYDSAFIFTCTLDDNSHKIFSSSQLDSLRKVIVKQQVNYILDTMTTPTSFSLLDRLFLRYNLQKDSILTQKFYTKLDKLADKKCVLVQKQFFYIFSLADSLVNKHLYLYARDTLEKFSKISANCNIDLDTIQKYIIHYRHPIVYQKCLDSFYVMVKNANWQAAWDKLFCSSEYYKAHRLYKYNVQRPDLYDIIVEQDINFVLFATKKLIGQDSLEISLKLLDFLRQNKIKASQVKDLQLRLGYRLALRDFLLHPDKKKYILLHQRIKKHRFWYRFLLKSYFLQQKKMRYFKI